MPTQVDFYLLGETAYEQGDTLQAYGLMHQALGALRPMMIARRRAFADDSLGRIWFGLYGGGIVRLENGRFTWITAEHGLAKGSIFGLLIDQTGRLWIGSAEGGVQRVDDPLPGQHFISRALRAQPISSTMTVPQMARNTLPTA